MREPITPAPVVETELPDLVYWDEFLLFVPRDAPPKLQSIVEGLGQSPDDRHKAFLIDLAFLPTPFDEQAYRLLLGKEPPVEIEALIDYIEERGFRTPADDLPSYVEFKQRLFNAIDDEFPAFLDPAQPRTISAQEVFWGGVFVDGIPPLDEPEFVTPEDAAHWIEQDDLVIGVEINGDARAYPRRIIDWHEMVNDTVGGIPVSLAYCTLCGTAILYDGRYGDEVFRFGTSGLLYRSNKLMYDRATRSLWEQYTGEPAWGPLVGQGVRLKVLPVVHTTYEEWLAAHPDTKVLDIDTGFRRDYGSGVAYEDYWASPDLIFPAPDSEGPLKRKDYVYSVRLDDALTAYPIALLSERTFIQDEVGGRSVVVVATADGTGGRAYERGSTDFVSADLEAGTVTSRDGRTWQIREDALVSGSDSLVRLPGHNSFWFAVRNHAPNWRLFEE